MATVALAGLLLTLSGILGCGGTEISAQKYDEASECWGPREVVDEDADAGGCDTVSVIATDADGDYWRFPDSCVPAGFDRVDDPNVVGELGGAPNCASGVP